MPCHHYRGEKVHGEIKALCTLCGRAFRNNSGIMTMHYRVMHTEVVSAELSKYFEQKQVYGALKVMCTLCGRVLRRNTHIMEVHYKMVHHPLENVPRHVCGLQQISSGDGPESHVSNATESRTVGALCDSRRNIDGTAKHTVPAAERLQWIDALAQRYPGVCTDPKVLQLILAKAPHGARNTLQTLLMEVQSRYENGVRLPLSNV
jgi:hypothetical protein